MGTQKKYFSTCRNWYQGAICGKKAWVSSQVSMTTLFLFSGINIKWFSVTERLRLTIKPGGFNSSFSRADPAYGDVNWKITVSVRACICYFTVNWDATLQKNILFFLSHLKIFSMTLFKPNHYSSAFHNTGSVISLMPKWWTTDSRIWCGCRLQRYQDWKNVQLNLFRQAPFSLIVWALSAL